MPAARTRRVNRRRRVRKRRGRPRARRVQRLLAQKSATPGVPPSMIRKLVFGEVSSLAQGTATDCVEWRYSLSNPYDPLFETGGGSCSGWTEMAGLYNKFEVLGSEITLTAQTNASQSAMAYLRRARDGTKFTDVDLLLRSDDVRSKLVHYDKNAVLKMRYNPKKDAAGQRLNPEEFVGLTSGTAPSHDSIVCVGLYDIPGITLKTIYFAVQIEYVIKFSDPIHMGLN